MCFVNACIQFFVFSLSRQDVSVLIKHLSETKTVLSVKTLKSCYYCTTGW